MRERRGIHAQGLALATLVAGCGSSAGAPSEPNDGGAEAQATYEAGTLGDGSTSVPANSDGGIDGACADFVAALFGCSLALIPDEVREARRYEQFCQNQVALPGSTTTAAVLEACAVALQADCNTQCDLPNVGTLPGGAPCNPGFDLQCQSGVCRISLQADGGYPSCGACATAVAIGQPCTSPSSTAYCVPGSYCSGGSASICVKVGAPGAACTGTSQCQKDSFCSASTRLCTTKVAIGGACTSDMECAGSFPCVGGKCTPPAAVGAACAVSGYSSACTHGATCDPTSLKCVVPSVQPGGTCGPGTPCVFGSCLSTGTCPTIVPDGQPCAKDDSQICDLAASCSYTGICEIPGSPICR